MNQLIPGYVNPQDRSARASDTLRSTGHHGVRDNGAMNRNPRTAGPIEQAALEQLRPLPKDPAHERIVLWRIFRTTEDAIKFSSSVLLGEGQQLVGGQSADDIGTLYWVGVQVDDLARWGNRRAIQMTDASDGQNPDPQNTL